MLKNRKKYDKSIQFSTFGNQFSNKMNKILLNFFLLLSFSISAQDYLKEINEIAEAELKSSSSLVDIQVNPNTLNYDVIYHRLEFEVDPAEYFISGNVTTDFIALENMNSITFDLGRITNTNNPYYNNRITVGSVMMNEEPLDFEHNSASKELIIQLHKEGEFMTNYSKFRINLIGLPFKVSSIEIDNEKVSFSTVSFDGKNTLLVDKFFTELHIVGK